MPSVSSQNAKYFVNDTCILLSSARNNSSDRVAVRIILLGAFGTTQEAQNVERMLEGTGC
jgi:hypothetical protein